MCRGVVHSWQGNLALSLADFAEAERIAVARDLPVLVAMSAHNTGVAYCRRGNLPAALAAFDRAQRAYEACTTRAGWWPCWRPTGARP